MTERLLVVGNLARDIIDNESTFGGSAANLSLGAKKNGVDVGIMSVLGVDGFSRKYRSFLADNGIDISLVENSLDELPICTVISSKNSISSSVWQDNGCHPAMDNMEVDLAEMSNYSLIHLVSCPPALAKRIALTGINISFEPGPMLIEDVKYFESEVAERSTLIFMNEEEYAVACTLLHDGLLSKDKYNNLLAVIVTLGKNGVKLIRRSSDEIFELDIPVPHIVDNVVDSTGAGDNFKAGFISGYLQGRSLEECAQIGSEMGAMCVMQNGGILPDDIVKKVRDKYNL